jgi:hypothetical protein
LTLGCQNCLGPQAPEADCYEWSSGEVRTQSGTASETYTECRLNAQLTAALHQIVTGGRSFRAESHRMANGHHTGKTGRCPGFQTGFGSMQSDGQLQPVVVRRVGDIPSS